MFEDDDLDDLDLGLEPSPGPRLQPHFPGSPIAKSFPLADSTSQVFSNGNRQTLTSTQKPHDRVGKHFGLANPQVQRPLGQRSLKTSGGGPQTSTQKDQEPGDESSQNSLGSLPSQALSIIPKATAAGKQHDMDTTSSPGFRFKSLSRMKSLMSLSNGNGPMQGNEINTCTTPSSPSSSLMTPESPSYSPRSLCELSSPVHSRNLSPGFSSQNDPHQQPSPSYSPKSPSPAAKRDLTVSASQLAGNREAKSPSDRMSQIPTVSSVDRNLPLHTAVSPPSSLRLTQSSIGDRSHRGFQLSPTKPSETENNLRRCSVLSEESQSSIPSNSSHDPSPPTRGTKRRFPGPAGDIFIYFCFGKMLKVVQVCKYSCKRSFDKRCGGFC